MDNVQSENYRVASYQCNNERKLKLESVLNLLQDSMECYAQKYDFGVDFSRKENKAWVIRNNDINIYALPTFDDRLVIDTRIEAMHKSILEISSTALSFFSRCGGVLTNTPQTFCLPCMVTGFAGRWRGSIPPRLETVKNPPLDTSVTIKPTSSICASIKMV